MASSKRFRRWGRDPERNAGHSVPRSQLRHRGLAYLGIIRRAGGRHCRRSAASCAAIAKDGAGSGGASGLDAGRLLMADQDTQDVKRPKVMLAGDVRWGFAWGL